MDRPAQCKTTILPPFVWVAGRELAITCTGMALLMVVGVPRAYAPQREKPEKISIDNVTWNSQAHAFLVELSALFGIGTAGDHAEFTLRTVVEIADWGREFDRDRGTHSACRHAGGIGGGCRWFCAAGATAYRVRPSRANPAGRGIALASGSPIIL